MSNDINMVVALLQRLDTQRARDCLSELVHGNDVGANEYGLEEFIHGVELIQHKTIKQVPALLRKDV